MDIEEIINKPSDEPADVEEIVYVVESYIYDRAGKSVKININKKPASFGLWFPETVFIANFDLLMHAYWYAVGWYRGRFEIQDKEKVK